MDRLFFCFCFFIQFNVPFKIISLIETSQSIGGRNGRTPGKPPDTPASRTWLVSHVASAGLEPTPDTAVRWTDCDEAGDCVVPNVLSPRDLVSRPDNMDETVPHTYTQFIALLITLQSKVIGLIVKECLQNMQTQWLAILI